MVTWKLVPEETPDKEWDENLLLMPDHNIYQSSSWARHKMGRGWKRRRGMASEGGRPAAMVQALYKTFPGGAILWSRGGPVGEPALWNADMRKTLSRGLGLCYMRICSYRDLSEGLSATLSAGGWRRPKKPFNRPLTFQVDLAIPEDSLFTGLSEHWRHNLRRGLKRCQVPRVWEKPKADELLSVYRRMESWKGIKKHYGSDELDSMLGDLKERVILLRADAESGEPIALRACVVQGDKAWDLLAAASDIGRKNYASYALFWGVLSRCRELGIKTYDMGGADPDLAKGVYDFKKGTGARAVDYLGEWDWSPLDLARRGVGLGLKAMGVGDQ